MPDAQRPLPNATFWHRATFWFLAVTTALRLLLLPALELVPDEAYYWDWSRRLSPGYYDQGPMIAYVIRLTTALFGTSEFGVRFGVLAASLGTLLCAYTLARRIFSPFAGFLTVALLGLTPLMAVGSLIATYDPLLVFFWALAAVFLERALFAPDPAAQRRAWLSAGLATGLGFLSKHTMLLLLPCLLLFLLLAPEHRFWLRRPQPYLALLLTLLLYTGVLWWNAQHHWWTFGHLLFLTQKASGSLLRRLGDFLGSQALLLGPVLFLGASGVGRWAFGDGYRPERAEKSLRSRENAFSQRPTPSARRLFLLCLGLPVFLFFCLMTAKAKVQGNWAPCAWLTLTVLWAGWLAGQFERSRRRGLRWAVAAGVTSGLLTLLILCAPLRAALGIRLPPEADLSNTGYGWRQTAAHVQQIRQAMEREGRRPVFLIGSGYQYVAELAFYLPDHPETQDMFLHYRLTMYAAHVERLKARLGQDAVFVNDTQAEDRDLRQIFERVAWDAPCPIWRRPLYSQPIRTLTIARCYNFRRYVGLDWAKGG